MGFFIRARRALSRSFTGGRPTRVHSASCVALATALFSLAFVPTAFAAGPQPRTNDLSSVCLVNATTGWAVGSEGAMMKTVNGGATWTSQKSGTAYWLRSVAFTDSSHGWAVGGAGTILVTTDGGSHWKTQSSGTGLQLNSVAFTDRSHGWAVGERGLILATTDGGGHWKVQRRPDNGIDDRSVLSVSFTDSKHGRAVEQIMHDGWDYYSCGILVTTDGGAHWTTQDVGLYQWLNAVTFTDLSHGWGVGRRSVLFSGSLYTIWSTVNGGFTWTSSTAGPAQDLNSVSFADAAHGWAVGDGGTIVSTINGGAGWASQNSGTTTDLACVDFASNATAGLAVGGGGTILRTIDGGATWTRQLAPLRTAVTLSNPLAPSTMTHAKSYTVHGYLKPRHVRGSQPVYIYEYKRVSGAWTLYGSVKATASNYRTYTKYSAKVKLPSAGKWRLRAYAPADGNHEAKWSSGFDYVRVK